MLVVAGVLKGADKSAIGPPYRVLKAGQRYHSDSIDYFERVETGYDWEYA